jgi:hypothetical protein
MAYSMTHHAAHSSARHAQSTLMLSPETAQSLAKGLGWFSIALGLTELLAPRKVTRALGMEGHEGLVQAYGLREIASGAGILASDQPAPWVWSRVAGDALDMATLASGLNDNNPKRDNVALALAAVGGITALDWATAASLTNGGTRRLARPVRDYSNRSGMPRPPEAMRGAARDFKIPRDMRTPEALRPWQAT